VRYKIQEENIFETRCTLQEPGLVTFLLHINQNIGYSPAWKRVL